MGKRSTRGTDQDQGDHTNPKTPLVIVKDANPQEETKNSEPLLPSLPDDIAKQCLFHLPYRCRVQLRSVSRSWNQALTDLNFSLPLILVLAAWKPSKDLQWQALDPRSGQRVVLPYMPSPLPVHRDGFACASLPRQGLVFVLGGMLHLRTTYYCLSIVNTHRIGTNRWSPACRMKIPRSFCAAGTIGGKIFVAGGVRDYRIGHPDTMTSVECYDPTKDKWVSVANMPYKLAAYDAAVVGGRMYVTGESFYPARDAVRGIVYDADKDKWEEMSYGMKRGWTGKSVVLGDRLFVITETRTSCSGLKVYIPENDTWHDVGGEDFPFKALKGSFVVCGGEGKVYVVSRGLDVGVGSVSTRKEAGQLWVQWDVMRAPEAFRGHPLNAQFLYC